MRFSTRRVSVFFFNDTATTEIYPLSLHAALPIFRLLLTFRMPPPPPVLNEPPKPRPWVMVRPAIRTDAARSEEHTSELQSQSNIVCRLLLEKKKKQVNRYTSGIDCSVRGLCLTQY